MYFTSVNLVCPKKGDNIILTIFKNSSPENTLVLTYKNNLELAKLQVNIEEPRKLVTYDLLATVTFDSAKKLTLFAAKEFVFYAKKHPSSYKFFVNKREVSLEQFSQSILVLQVNALTGSDQSSKALLNLNF
jgi:hypothetical protein